MENHEVLQRLGLSEIDTKIYTSLLNSQALTVAEIAKSTGIYRPTIYKALPPLIEKNLVSRSQKGKRNVYYAEPPQSLNNLVDKVKLDLARVLPDLINNYSHNQNKPSIRYFEGAKGIQYVYGDLLTNSKKGDVIYRYESPKDYKRNKKYYPALYMEKAGGIESQIQKFVITNEKTHNLRRPQVDRYSKPISAKYDPFEYDITEIIYKDRVAFIDYESETASIIESPAFAKFQRSIFKLLFNTLLDK